MKIKTTIAALVFFVGISFSANAQLLLDYNTMKTALLNSKFAQSQYSVELLGIEAPLPDFVNVFLDSIKNDNVPAQIVKVNHFVNKLLTYESPTSDHVRNVADIIKGRRGDCADYTAVKKIMLNQLGIKTDIIIGISKKFHEYHEMLKADNRYLDLLPDTQSDESIKNYFIPVLDIDDNFDISVIK